MTRPLRETYPEPSRPRDPVDAAVFARINADRQAAGRAPVAWDEGAARVARAFCQAQVHERTRGHFLTDGIPPYARTALAGVFGVQAENSTAWLSSAREFQKSMTELALGAHTQMMEEKPPADGHRKAILDPDATHVGVGWAQESGSFRMAQEFMTRRMSEMALTRVAQAPATILVEGKVASPYRVEFVTLAHEPAPRHLTKSEANARTSYGYPDRPVGLRARGPKVSPRHRRRDRGPAPDSGGRRILVPVHASPAGALDDRHLHERSAQRSPSRRARRALDGAGKMITILVVGAPAAEASRYAAGHPSVEILVAGGTEEALEKLARNRRIDAVLLLSGA